jgi:hypothetical protein
MKENIPGFQSLMYPILDHFERQSTAFISRAFRAPGTIFQGNTRGNQGNGSKWPATIIQKRGLST